MENRVDWEKKFQEDLERAQALSLESLALERFKLNKLSQEKHRVSTKNVSVNRAASMSQTDSGGSKSRPRPEIGSNSMRKNSLLAPPPPSQRKNSEEMVADLISFSSPPLKSSNVLDLSSLQQAKSTEASLMDFSGAQSGTTATYRSVINPPHWTNQSSSFQFYQHQKHQNSLPSSLNNARNMQFLSSDQSDAGNAFSKGSEMKGPSSTHSIQISQQKSASFHRAQQNEVTAYLNNPPPPTLPPKNQHRTPPPIALPSSQSSVILKTQQRRRATENLIDLNLDNNSSVRVSILQEFDPILCSNELNLNQSRTISPECPDDSASSICDSNSVYDEYDPYEFIYTNSGNNSLSDPMYAAVNKSENLYSAPLTSEITESGNGDRRFLKEIGKTSAISPLKLAEIKGSLQENIIQTEASEETDPELLSFFNLVQNVRNRYRYNDPDTNMGFVISPMVSYEYKDGTSIKMCVHPDFDGAEFDKPFIFTCDVNSSIEHITLQATCDLEAPSEQNYTLKVWGLNEYFAPTTLLSDYEYVHNCIKLEEDVTLVLIPDKKVDKSFARTALDDKRDQNLVFGDVIPTNPTLHITYENMKIVLEFLENEIEKLMEQAKLALDYCNKQQQQLKPDLHPNAVIQSVKYVINLMNNLCTVDIMEAVANLVQTCNLFNNCPQTAIDDVETCCNVMKINVLSLINMYCSTFNVDFKLRHPIVPQDPVLNVNEVCSSLTVRICSIYRPNNEWKHDFYMAAAQVYHGTKPVKKCIATLPCAKTEDHSWPARIVFNHWITFEDIPISSLAKESRLVIVLYGRTTEPNENNNNNNNHNNNSENQTNYKQEEIGWASVQLFNFNGFMASGEMLLSIWPKSPNFIYGPAPSGMTNCDQNHPIIGIEISTAAANTVKFPDMETLNYSVVKGDFSSLDQQTQDQLFEIGEMNMLEKIQPEMREILWEKRHYLYDFPECLPKVLLAAHSWEFACLPDLHGMLHSWKNLSPVQALQLLLPTFPDTEVRKHAVKWISRMNTDELVDYLPQLVVALKFETYDNSKLAEFLLDRSMRSARFAHYLFWLLSHNLPGPLPQNSSLDFDDRDENNVRESRYFRRTKLLLRALLAICGEALRNCFMTQQLLVKELNDCAENVRKTKDSLRQNVLQQALQRVDADLRENETSLPLSLTLRVSGVQVQTCSYFTSNALPLKINFFAPQNSTIVPAIYKISDDLQQDMLTLQMVRLMDKMWLNHGLDLKMVSFICIPTGKRKGMIELVKNAETLRKIQVEHGLTGSFKDKPIAEWLEKHNPSELEYGRAVENFTASCAGYCVVTYILGIGDRHNDNIMLKKSGHLFHIDFGKFLGDAQMFGNFKRDRAPFVLTSDMAYVINGGDRPSEKFHKFVDLCCQAFNIVRANGNLILYIFTLMMSSGMCGVSTESVNYLHNALLPKMSNPEAAAYFARLIESSLKSWFTQFNFFLHNLAQLKFSGEHNDGSLLSFVPKTYTMETDGKLKHVEVVSYRKLYDPDKYYVYVLRVYREENGPPMEILRTYKEFCEFQQKLCIYFPLAKLHSLSSGLHVGRSNIKQVAEKRYHEVCLFVKSLFLCAKEIAHSDPVYTFFHPMLRDQQFHENEESGSDFGRKRTRERAIALDRRGEIGRLKGQLKLSLTFSKGVFSVMVHHVRGLALLSNGQEPSTYVKVYLRPDVTKSTKRKTKVVKRNRHPSFMEMLEYRMALETVRTRLLRATVWNYDALQENEFLGGVELDLAHLDLTNETTEWYPLANISR